MKHDVDHVCDIHRDASVMNSDGTCETCLDDAHMMTITANEHIKTRQLHADCIVRKNALTNNTVSAFDDEVLGWVTICDAHDDHVSHDDKATARDMLATPQAWCSGCASIAKASV